MRTSSIWPIAFGFVLMHQMAFAAENCSDGQRRIAQGEPCIPASMFEYLYCLSQSGGGRVEVATSEGAAGSKKWNIKVAGQGSGVVVKGSGSVEVGRDEASQAVKESIQKYSGSLPENCKAIAMIASTPNMAPPSDSKKEMGPLERGVGMDHSDIDAAGWLSLTSPEACSDVCRSRADCKAMTYVISNKSCWLKYTVPRRTGNLDEVSAAKR